MSLTAIQALQTAVQMSAALTDNIEIDGFKFTPDQLRDEFERGLASLRQGPRVLSELDVFKLIREEIQKVGSEAELARRMGITRQSLHAVYNAERAPGPAILGYFRLRKISSRNRYERM